MVVEDFEGTDMGYVTSSPPGGASQIDRILDRIPGIVDAYRRPQPTAVAVPVIDPVPAGTLASGSGLMLIILIGVLVWAVTR